MANRFFLALISTLLISTTVFSADTLKKLSSKFFKVKESYEAEPIGVCYSQRLNGIYSSIQWLCNADKDGNDYINSFRYNNSDCSGNGEIINTFTHTDRHRFPFNCKEDGEEEEFEASYMILKVSEATRTVYNKGDKDQWADCKEVDAENSDYRTTIMMTNQCTLSWQRKDDGTMKPYWYFAMCSSNAVYIERWDGEDCTGNMDLPQYRENGCRKKLGKHWYYQVAECTHPADEYMLDHDDGYKQRNIIGTIIIIIFAVIY